MKHKVHLLMATNAMLFSLFGCSIDEKVKLYEQTNLALQVPELIKRYMHKEESSYSYDYSVLCDGLLEGYTVPINTPKESIVPPALTSKLNEIYNSGKICKAQPTDMLMVLASIDKYTKDYNSPVTILLQIPWNEIEIKTINELKKEVKKISLNSNKINKIILFGSSGAIKQKADIFHDLKEKVVSGGVDLPITEQNIKDCKLPLKSSVMVFLIPVESTLKKVSNIK